MAYLKVVHLNHGGTTSICSDGVVFVDMVTKVIFFKEAPSFESIEDRVRRMMGWMDANFKVQFSGRYDAGMSYRSYAQLIPISTQEEWEIYRQLVEDSSVRSLVILAETPDGEPRANIDLDLNSSPCLGGQPTSHSSALPDVLEDGLGSQPLAEDCTQEDNLDIDLNSSPCQQQARIPDFVQGVTLSQQSLDAEDMEQENNGGFDLNEPLADDGGDGDSNSDQDVEGAEEPIETPAVLPVIQFPDIGRAADDAAVVSDELDPATFGIRNQEAIPCNVACADDSDDEGPPLYTPAEAAAFLKVYGRKHTISWFMDLSEAHRAVIDGGRTWLCEPEMPEPQSVLDAQRYPLSKPLIYPGLTFKTIQDMKIWMAEYAVRHFRTYVVLKSNQTQRYVLRCPAEDCQWVMRAQKRPYGESWKISSCVVPHTCANQIKEGTHRQLTSTFLAHRLCDTIAKNPAQTAGMLQSYIKHIFLIDVKYGKAWRTKPLALRMSFGDWDESYGHLPEVLQAMAARNPRMMHIVVPHKELIRVKVGETIVPAFGMAFWCFRPSIDVFKHCRPVVCVDATFLTGRYKGALMLAVGCGANSQLVPLAFGLVERESKDTWEWFMHHVRTKVFGPGKEVCVISDRHKGILHAVKLEIPGHPLVKHRWCMRHSAANFFTNARRRELTEQLHDVCMANEPKIFNAMYQELKASCNKKATKFLDEHYPLRKFWA